jgi:DNA (cytosine-5)-methyltransferase 1
MSDGKLRATNLTRAIDLFCGIGGSSWGARTAGAQILAGFDLWSLAGETFQDNFPEATFYEGKIEEVNVTGVAQELGRVDLILASPECTNHSPAKGSKARSEESKMTAFQVIRFAQELNSRWIVVENVVSMRKWDRYAEFIKQLKELGYKVRQQILNAADFGVPQKRRRLFIICDKERTPDKVIPVLRIVRNSASNFVNMNGQYSSSQLNTPRRAKATLERASRAIQALGSNESFLLVYYGSDKAGGWQRLDVPLRTVTTLDRFALVKPTPEGHVMRMLQVPELKAAMGMPAKLKIERGSRRDKIRMIGNAVCPPVMKAVVKSLTK